MPAYWAETDYGLSDGQHAVLPKGEGKGKDCAMHHYSYCRECTGNVFYVLNCIEIELKYTL